MDSRQNGFGSISFSSILIKFINKMMSHRFRSKTETTTARNYLSLKGKINHFKNENNLNNLSKNQKRKDQQRSSSNRKKFLRVYSSEKISHQDSPKQHNNNSLLDSLRKFLNSHAQTEDTKNSRKKIPTEPSFFQGSPPAKRQGTETPIQELLDLSFCSQYEKAKMMNGEVADNKIGMFDEKRKWVRKRATIKVFFKDREKGSNGKTNRFF